MSDNNIERQTYTVDECAKILGISRVTAYNMANSGQLPVLKLGIHRLLVSKQALDKMLAEAGMINNEG